MAKGNLESKFVVVLRDGIPANELKFIQSLSGAIKLDNGAKLRQFTCTKVDTSDIHYIDMEVSRPGQPWRLPLRIPHAYVLLISGRERGGRAPGFASSFEEE
jgi:hypothetical protein